MIKYASVTSLITTILFVALNFTTSKFQAFNNNIHFGYPFVFFTSEPEYLNGANKDFSLFNLGIDLICCLTVACLIVSLFTRMKQVKKLA
jgi:hypothetical protein